MTIIEGFIAVVGGGLGTSILPKLFDKVFPSGKEQAAVILAHSQVEDDLRTALHEEIQRLRERCDKSDTRALENAVKFTQLDAENRECRKRNDLFEHELIVAGQKINKLEADLARHIEMTKGAINASNIKS